MIEPTLNHSGTERLDDAVEALGRPQLRFGLGAKIILLGAGVLLPLAALTWFIAVESLRRNMTQEFTSKGVSIAESLANSAVDPILTRDASTDQALVDQYVGNSGVAYVLVYDAHNAIIAHTFVPRVPPALIEQHRGAGTQSQQVREIRYADPATGTERQIIDVAVPMLAGRLGIVHVGMDQAIIAAAATRAGNSLLLLFAAIAALSTAAAALFARRVTRPLTRLMDAATRVGQGDLSKLVPITSRDEIGQLAATFNETIVRLRSLVRTEAERDELKKLTTDLTEALEQQTATSEILRVISSSPSDLAPVFDSILANAMRLCVAHLGMLFLYDGEAYNAVAMRGANHTVTESFRRVVRPKPGTGLGRVLVEKRPVHIPDLTDDDLYRQRDPLRVATIELLGARTWLAAPLLKDGAVVGAICIYRREVLPFPEAQIKLVQTFADQAVIAIENVRLFKELQTRTAELGRSVEELKALGEVGRAVSSTLDTDKVLTTIITHANQLAGTDAGWIYDYDDVADVLRPRAADGFDEKRREALWRVRFKRGEGAMGQGVLMRQPVQIPDISVEGAYESSLKTDLIADGFRGLLAMPLMREDQLLGGLILLRKQPGEFQRPVVELLATFASQSALAMQNARLFRELEQKSHELEEASRHKSQFLANMSHELRTPLNAILGYTELVIDQVYGDVPEKIGEVLDRVQKNGRHLLGLINDVLDLSKIEAGQLTLGMSDYSFSDVVQAVVSSVGSLAAEKQLQLTVDVAPDLPVGRGDERRITQVLLNLVGNAIKFTEKGKVAVRVSASDGTFLAAVADTGPGIKQEDREKIFEEFQQSDSSLTRNKTGTGLGLAIAKNIVELHGGHIWVESTLGEGSTFYLRIPVRSERPEVTP